MVNVVDDDSAQPLQVIKQTSLVLGLSNGALALVQIVVAWWSGSTALFADAMHTFSDLIFDIITYFAGVYGAMPPDAVQPYGYRRIETLTAILLAIILALLGVFILHSAWKYADVVTVESDYVVVAAAISIIINEGLYRYAAYQAERINSQLLYASASHQRSDALSSVVVLVTAGLDVMGVSLNMDFYGALFIGFMIFKMGFSICLKGLRELMDAGIDQDEIDAIKQDICASPGVSGVHLLRSRKLAGDIYIDLHIITDSYISVSEGHYIGETTRQRLKQQFRHIADVTVHIDPEDDEAYHDQPLQLPSRLEIINDLVAIGADFGIKSDENQLVLPRLVVHYIKQKVVLELYIPAKTKLSQDSDAMLAKLQALNTNYAQLLLYFVPA